MNDFALFGTDLLGDIIKPKASSLVANRFTWPPFTLLDGRQGEWQERKRAWAALGIKGEVGRGFVRPHGKDTRPVAYSWDSKYEGGDCWRGAAEGGTAASIFDPVICELFIRWFSAEGAQIVDPFAGGSVRGIVAGALGRKYWGCDLRAEQIEANERQADEIRLARRPVWVCGDSIETLDAAPAADMIFSCPPYGNLERYSDDARDLSTMEWHTFVAAYRRIILRTVARMKPNTFACFVVGDFRDKKGFYRNFIGTTVDAFQQCGALLYNEAIFCTPAGTAAMRITKQFDAGRKLAKTHQNVLVFCKGDWRAAVANVRAA